MMPSPTELTYFLEIASTGNISRASERLGIAQPTLSLAIKRLENVVGTDLLLRSKTGVSLTRAGLRLSSKAQHLLEQWQSVLESVKREDTELAGSYRIGAHPSVACGRFASALPAILSQHPRLELNMLHDLSRRVTEKVINFELDFAIAVNPIAHPDLVIRKLYTDEVNFFCRHDYDISNPNRLLCYDAELTQARWLLKQAKSANISFPRTLHSSSLEFICALVSKGAGIGILPGIPASQTKNSLHIAPFCINSFIDTHALIYRADSQTSQASRKLARVLEQAMLKNEPWIS